MHIELLVEEPSAGEVLHVLVPKIVPSDTSFAIHTFQGKHDLFRKLPARLRGYGAWLPEDGAIVVLVDRDDEDCRALKARLEGLARAAGLATRSTAGGQARVQVVNRLAIEELEAWFFGDVAALVAAYPGVSTTLGKQRRYRDPDAITGGTWEALERVLQRAGYHKTGLEKIEAARRIAHHLAPERNRSKSFQVFRDALRMIAANA